jgi:ribosomal protein S14
VRCTETMGKIRRRELRDGENISSVAQSLQLSRNTVREYLTEGIDPVYRHKHRVEPQLGARRLFECLQAEGYGGACDSGQRHGQMLGSTIDHVVLKSPAPSMAAAS